MPQYSAYQPKPYRPRMSPYWYLDRWPYLRFMVRETSCVFVAYFAVVMLLQIRAIEHGAGAYAQFQAWMSCPAVMILNAIALGLVIFHAVTWFALVPRVFARHMLGTSIPDLFAAVPNYGAWFVASLVVALFALRLI
ncbi:MAG: fumarate reductase subunit C [Candidatus Binataceae bacterium]